LPPASRTSTTAPTTGLGAHPASGGTRSTGQTGPAVAVPRIPVCIEDDAAGEAEVEAAGVVVDDAAGDPLADGDAEAPTTWAAEQPASRIVATTITSDASQELRGRSMTQRR
jgi:hypothetical protein